MSTHYPTVYKIATGEIVQTGMFSCDEDFVDMNCAARVHSYGGTTHDVVDASADPAIHYVAVLDEKETVVERPELVVHIDGDKRTLQADGVDTITLTGLPDPCDIIVGAPDPGVETQTFTVEGGGFVFSADDPGVYTVEVRRWPFLPFKVEFTAL